MFGQSAVSAGMLAKSGTQIHCKLPRCCLNEDQLYGNLSDTGPAEGGLGKHCWCLWASRLPSAVVRCCWLGRRLRVPHLHLLGQLEPARLGVAGGLWTGWHGARCWLRSRLPVHFMSAKQTPVSGNGLTFRHCWNLSCWVSGEGCQLEFMTDVRQGRRAVSVGACSSCNIWDCFWGRVAAGGPVSACCWHSCSAASSRPLLGSAVGLEMLKTVTAAHCGSVMT